MEKYFIQKIQYIGLGWKGSTSVCLEFGLSVDNHVLGDQILLIRRLSVSLSENCFGSKNVLFEEVLLDEFFQEPLESPKVDGLVPFAVVIEAVFL